MYEQDPTIQEGRLVLGNPGSEDVEVNGVTLTKESPLCELRAACKIFSAFRIGMLSGNHESVERKRVEGSCRGSSECKKISVKRARTSHCTSTDRRRAGETRTHSYSVRSMV